MASPQPNPTSPGKDNWEGEGTLHSYCYDYMRKRGWNETASAFALDAGINEEEWKGPPIEAPQGLLYEWWSVFWDVFIARSQSTGKRNPMADSYVESMRVKKDSLQIQFAGQSQSQNIELPRSLAHPPRVPILHQPPPPRPTYTNPGQQHVIQQQQLQEQLQQGRVGPPMIGRPGPQYHPQASTSQGPPHQQQQPGHSPYQQNLPHPLQAQGYQHPSRPGSAQSSPNLSHAPHPYGNGRAPPPQQPIGIRGGPQDPAFTQALAAIGLAGRNIEDLNPEEQATFELHMRRIGQLPSLQGQQQYRRGPPPPSQRMTAEQHRIQQHLIQQQQQQQMQLQQQLQQRGQYAPPPPPPASARISPSNSGRVQDPSPRQRKRQRPSKEHNSTGGETPRFDVSGPPSPANSQFAIQNGSNYLPSQSPVSNDLILRGMEANGRNSQQSNDGGAAMRQAAIAEARLNMTDQLNGDMIGNGMDEHAGLQKNGNGNGPSRPGSSTAFNRPSFNASLEKNSPKLSPNHLINSPNGIPGQPPLQISIPPPPNGNSFQLQTADTTPGGSRPFAGASNLSNSNISDFGPAGEVGYGGGPPIPFEHVGDDLLGLASLDFSFDSFIDFDKDA